MEKLEMFARYLWPLILMWNIFLFQGQQSQGREFQEYKLYVAQNYTNKADLQKIFEQFENRLDEKLSIFVELVKK